jgi:hypothetical protein
MRRPNVFIAPRAAPDSGSHARAADLQMCELRAPTGTRRRRKRLTIATAVWAENARYEVQVHVEQWPGAILVQSVYVADSGRTGNNRSSTTMAYGSIRTPKTPVPPQWPPHHPQRPGIERPARRLAGGKLVTTATLTSRTCKWPIGDPVEPGFHYCGHPPEAGRPYCDTHDVRSYQGRPRPKAS